jgi:Flp pilus assembly protein TadG
MLPPGRGERLLTMSQTRGTQRIAKQRIGKQRIGKQRIGKQRIGKQRSTRRTRDRGSMAVELAIIAPGLILLLLLVAAGGRVVEVQGHMDGAARDAARAASLAETPGQADQLALQAASADLGSTSWCTPGSVQAPVTGFPGGNEVVVPGANVTVTVACSVDMSPFRLLGFSPAMHFSGTAVAPLDSFTCRGAGC